MADLTVTLTESGTISGETVSDSESITITGITNIYHAKLQAIDNSNLKAGLIYIGDSTQSVGSGDPYDHIKYCRITNVDTEEELVLKVEYNEPMCYRLRPGESLVLYDFQKYSQLLTVDASPNPPFVNIEDIGTLTAGTTPCWIEIFMASDE